MAGKKGQKKRYWSDDEKRSICAQTIVAGVSIAQVARRYSMNANLIHTWLKDPRFTPAPEANEPAPGIEFLPIEICLSPLELCQCLCVTGGMEDGSEAIFG